MIDDENAVELFRRYRPKSFKGVIGQTKAVTQLKRLLESGKLPRALLLTGPSGVGKTTLARILKEKLGCTDTDFREINAAEDRGIDMIRSINERKGASALGKCRIYLIDECARLTPDGQSAALKMLEDVPSHVYFVLCTTDPQKLLPTIRTRCTEIKLDAVPKKELCELIASVVTKATEGDSKQYPPDEVIEAIAEAADGSPRKALVILHQVIGLATAQEQLDTINKADTKRKAFDLVKNLLWDKSNWATVAKTLEDLENEDIEGLRRMIISIAGKEMRKAGRSAKWASLIVYQFRNNFFDSGLAGLTLACFDVIDSRK